MTAPTMPCGCSADASEPPTCEVHRSIEGGVFEEWIEPDPNVWMLPPEIVEAIDQTYTEALDFNMPSDKCPVPLNKYEAIWWFCFGALPTADDFVTVGRAVFAGRASGNVLLTRKAEARNQ